MIAKHDVDEINSEFLVPCKSSFQNTFCAVPRAKKGVWTRQSVDALEFAPVVKLHASSL